MKHSPNRKADAVGRRRPEKVAPSQGRGRGWLFPLLAGMGILLAVGALGPWWRRVDRVSAAIELQAEALTAESRRSEKKAVDAIIRHVDRMDREEIRKVRNALDKQLSDVRQQSMDRYFAADVQARPALLDADLDRLQTVRELWLAVTPQAGPQAGSPGGRRPGNLRRRPPTPGKQSESERRLVELYTAALQERAQKRGLSLPTDR
jgi:hypothetical protein